MKKNNLGTKKPSSKKSVKTKVKTAKTKTWPESHTELKNFIIGSAISFLASIALIFLTIFFCESLFSFIKGDKVDYFSENVSGLDNIEGQDGIGKLDEFERLSNVIYFGKEDISDDGLKNNDISDDFKLSKENEINLGFEDSLGQELMNNDFIVEESEFMTLPAEGSGFENLNFLNSPDGSKFAFIVKQNSKEAVLLNGDLGPFYDRITFMVFSPDSRRFAYGARVGADEMVVLDGLPGKIYDWVFLPRFFSPDSQYFVYKARSLEGDFLVFNESEGKVYQQIYQPFVNSDNSALIFYSRNGQKIYKSVLKLNPKK